MRNSSVHYVPRADQFLILLLLSVLFAACSDNHHQPNSPEIWLGDSLEAMRIGDTTDTNARHELSNAEGLTLSFSLRTTGHLLCFQSPYSTLKKHGPAGSLNQYTLRISQQTDSSLTFIPVSAEARAFFGRKRVLFFRKQSVAVDTTIHFEKIVFHTTECFGYCPVFHLEIDSARYFRQHTEILYSRPSDRRDTTREGYFTGRVPERAYRNLLAALKTSRLRDLHADEMLCCDAPIVTIILYANGNQKPFRSMFIPIAAQNLVHVLYQIAREQSGTRTQTPFTLEGGNDSLFFEPGKITVQ